jgi:hypothetical protein
MNKMKRLSDRVINMDNFVTFWRSTMATPSGHVRDEQGTEPVKQAVRRLLKRNRKVRTLKENQECA